MIWNRTYEDAHCLITSNDRQNDCKSRTWKCYVCDVYYMHLLLLLFVKLKF
jgi:hypothetical protein